MKALVFSLFFCAASVFSRSVDTSKHLSKRSGLKTDLDELVLQSIFFSGHDCNRHRKSLCMSWYRQYGGSKELGNQVGVYCGRYGAINCDEIYEQLEQKAEELEETLSELRHPTTTQCHHFAGLCLFLKPLFPELEDACNKFEARCYIQTRHDAAVSVLLKGLTGKMDTPENCRNALGSLCLYLSGLFPELRSLCLFWPGTCTHLKEIADKQCQDLENELEAVSSENSSEEKCQLVGECSHVSGNCNDKVKTKCKDLATACAKNKHAKRSQLDEIPHTNKTLVEGVFNKTLEETSVFIQVHEAVSEEPHDPSLALMLLGENGHHRHHHRHLESQCHRHLNNCSLYDTDPFINELCTNGHENSEGEEACHKFPHRLTRPSNGYLANLTNFFSQGGSVLGDTDPFSRLYSANVDVSECEYVYGLCYFFGHYGGKHIQDECIKYTAHCYETSLAKAALEHILGKDYNDYSSLTSDSQYCQKQLANNCKKIPPSDLFGLYYCLKLDSTCDTLESVSESLYQESEDSENGLLEEGPSENDEPSDDDKPSDDGSSNGGPPKTD